MGKAENRSEDYIGRYPRVKSRVGVWREIVRYVHHDIGPVDTLLELGAGYCDFVNQFPARRKVAFDVNPEMRPYAAGDVDLRIEDVAAGDLLEKVGSVDLVFASNFLEHLDQHELGELLPKIRQVLRPGGGLVLLQPNHDLSPEHYFDDPTHKTVFSHKTIAGFLGGFGFTVTRLIPGLLPFSMKSRLPKFPILVRLYLNSPFRPFAGQMYVVAERS